MLNRDFSTLLGSLATVVQNTTLMILMKQNADLQTGRTLGLNKPYLDLDDLLRDIDFRTQVGDVLETLKTIGRSTLWEILVLDRNLRAFHPDRTEQLLAIGVKPMILGVSNSDPHGSLYLDMGGFFI